MTTITEQDKKQLADHGIQLATFEKQIKTFENGVAPIQLTAPATIGHGILRFTEQELTQYESIFTDAAGNIKIQRFVPASGAASRMFKAFHQYLDDGIENDEIRVFREGLQSFAFYDKIKCQSKPEYSCAIHNMIKVQKLSELPKALIPFHAYEDGSRTSFEEHLAESAAVLTGCDKIDIHFTISEAHRAGFEALLAKKLPGLEEKYGCRFTVEFSYQHPSTDTVAVNNDNTPFRNADGSMVLRPGGHGSLIANLNDLDAELVFIKNIDNIQIEHLRDTSLRYKKILAGYLIALQKNVKEATEQLAGTHPDIQRILAFVKDTLNGRPEADFASLSQEEQINWLKTMLHKPIRVCGMVKNEGEPGGGPFWTRNSKGIESLQIVESSQIDLAQADQKDILNRSTHFNPVDLVCWLKDVDGSPFDLNQFIDRETSFISEKSQQGQTFKVLEHPGLWNGAMAHWITIFVEVPIATFSPVKTINDLLRPQHQPQ